jgi:hypothetical protein
LAAISTVISGTAWLSTTSTCSPFGQVCCWMAGGAALAPVLVRKTAAAMAGKETRRM